MNESSDLPPGPPEDDEPIPVFGSWRCIYLAVIVSNVVVMALIALFSAWAF